VFKSKLLLLKFLILTSTAEASAAMSERFPRLLHNTGYINYLRDERRLDWGTDVKEAKSIFLSSLAFALAGFMSSAIFDFF
jgi:hypothetical protein